MQARDFGISLFRCGRRRDEGVEHNLYINVLASSLVGKMRKCHRSLSESILRPG